MIFDKLKKQTAPTAAISYKYIQSDNYRGFKRLRLTAYGYAPAMKGVKAVSKMDITGAEITINIIGGEHTRAEVYVGRHHVGTIWKQAFDEFSIFKNGKVQAVRVEIRNGNESYLFYKV